MEKPWWNKLLWLLVAFVIAGAIRFIYREMEYKKEIPIDKMKTEWQLLGPSTMTFEGQNYDGDVFFDRLNLEKQADKVTMWIKIKTVKPVIVQKNNETYTWDEQITRWTINCGAKQVKADYISLSFEGKKQFGYKVDDLNVPIVKGTTSCQVYESVCF